MSRAYKFRDPDALYFVTTATIRWIDVFTRRNYKDILIDSLEYCTANKGLQVHAYVIMSNHIHLIISRENSSTELPGILRDFKKFTSMHLIKAIKDSLKESRRKWLLDLMQKAGKQNANNTNYQLWQQDNHPIQLQDNWIDQKLNYIHENPVRAGWSLEPHEYYYSSARNYAGLESPMKIISLVDGTII